MAMGSSTSLLLMGGELIYIELKTIFHEANNKRDMPVSLIQCLLAYSGPSQLDCHPRLTESYDAQCSN